jgi:hypothetical protein
MGSLHYRKNLRTPREGKRCTKRSCTENSNSDGKSVEMKGGLT